MMSVGLHCRLAGRRARRRPGSASSITPPEHEKVWIARRLDIARHWHEQHRRRDMTDPLDPRALSRDDFVAAFGAIFEHSPWIAEAAFDAGLPAEADSAAGLHGALCAASCAPHRQQRPDRRPSRPRRTPGLAGRLTAESNKEQASAGLDTLTEDELARFTALNDAYKAKFGFPFIMAVKGRQGGDPGGLRAIGCRTTPRPSSRRR